MLISCEYTASRKLFPVNLGKLPFPSRSVPRFLPIRYEGVSLMLVVDRVTRASLIISKWSDRAGTALFEQWSVTG